MLRGWAHEVKDENAAPPSLAEAARRSYAPRASPGSSDGAATPRAKWNSRTEFLLATIGNCVGVGNGTDALFLALLALGVGPGDEVITAANSFVATAEAITMTGATPVFIDCDPNRYTLDLNQVENALTSRAPRVKALVPVHLYGLLVDMPRLMNLARKAGVKVLEDAAQAHDARYEEGAAGSFGDMAAFSFYPGKNLGAFGDGGAVVTRDAELAEQVRKLANHGRVGKYDHVLSGHNSRLDTLQAAILSVKLRHLPAWSESRRKLAHRYVERLAEVADRLVPPTLPEGNEHVFHLYVTRCADRDGLRQFLAERKIASGVHYPISLPNLAAHRHLGLRAEDFPVSTRYQDEIVSLPLFPEMTVEEQDRVVDAVLKWLS